MARIVNAVTTVDATGVMCPLPIVWMAERMKTLAIGDVIEVLATDAAILDDLPSWCRATGHEYLGIEIDGSTFRGYARRSHA